MRLAIVEDEKIHQDYLIDKLETAAKKESIKLSIHVFNTAEKFLEFNKSNWFDGILLDIRLDEMNGFSLAKRIREKDDQVPIAFITGEKDYVFKGYDVDACAYILKPIEQNAIDNLVKKLIVFMENSETPLLIKTKENNITVYKKNIVCIESNDHQTILTTLDKTYVCIMKMKEWQEALDDDMFYKPHRTCFMNIDKIHLIEKKQVIMCNGQVLPIARGKWEPLMQAYMTHRRQVY